MKTYEPDQDPFYDWSERHNLLYRLGIPRRRAQESKKMTGFSMSKEAVLVRALIILAGMMAVAVRLAFQYAEDFRKRRSLRR